MDSDQSDPKADNGPKKKKRYEAPRIEESGSFERLVVACTHKPGPCGSPVSPNVKS